MFMRDRVRTACQKGHALKPGFRQPRQRTPSRTARQLRQLAQRLNPRTTVQPALKGMWFGMHSDLGRACLLAESVAKHGSDVAAHR